MSNKVKSFTLSELLVVMIITAIVVGMAFSVLRLVQKQVHTIEANFDKTSSLSLFEQHFWQDFNQFNTVRIQKGNTVVLQSEIDTVTYVFSDNFILRDKDTIKLKLGITKTLFKGKDVGSGTIDAISISAENELPNYSIFVSRKNDATLMMNQDGI